MKQVFIEETGDFAGEISRLNKINRDLFQREVSLQKSQ